MVELTTGSHLLGYYNYSLVVSNFVRLLADTVFNQLLDVLGVCLANKLDHDLLSVCCDSLVALLLFPFENSYVSFASDLDLSEHTVNQIPLRWSTRIFHVDYLFALQQVSCSPATRPDVSLAVVRFVATLAACRLDPGLPEDQYQAYLKYQMTFVPTLLHALSAAGRQLSQEILELLVDLIGRL